MKSTNVVDVRDSKGRLKGKYYPDEGIFEIAEKGTVVKIIFPVGTKIVIESKLI